MFVFGAGASFDSDPGRVPSNAEAFFGQNEHRPPLARDLFDPPSLEGGEIVRAFPRAAPLLLELREAVRRGADVEEVLEGIKATEDLYARTSVQLMAFRGYLARLLSEVPERWLEECNGLTNYVSLLSKADRWNVITHGEGDQPISCVTFNYDALLESAVHSVFGYRVATMADHIASKAVHVLKPHGSVTWQQGADWQIPETQFFPGAGAMSEAIDRADQVTWRDSWRVETGQRYQERGSGPMVWLPALSVPVRRKTTFTMPADHQQVMVDDLSKVTTLITIGWRARERHFLYLIQQHLPSEPVRLVSVAESDTAAMETIDNLWPTGRFDRYRVCGTGFTGFMESLSDPPERFGSDSDHTALTFDHLVAAGSSGDWTLRDRGQGFA